MELLQHLAIGAGGGALVGALAGFIAALLALGSKIWRNGRLQARGLPGIKDCVLPLPFVILSGIASAILGAILGAFITPLKAVLIGGLVPAGLLVVLSVGGSVTQAFGD
jgi:hypothetical protein